MSRPIRKRDYGLTRDQRGVWHCDFSVAGRRFQRSCFTEDKKAAEEYCASLASGAWREKKLGENPQITWGDAVPLWLRAKQDEGKRDLANDLLKIKVLGQHLNPVILGTVTAKAIDDVLDKLQEERGFCGATRNRYRAIIVGVMNHARKKYDVANEKPEHRKEADDGFRYLTKEEATSLIGELPLHLKRMVIFSLATGLRQSNVTGLLWRNVDMDRRVAWVWAEDAKGKRHISIPLNDTAMAVLREAKACESHGNSRVVFTYYGEPVEQPAGAAWKKAKARASITHFRWHDLRHTWASWHVMGWMSKDGTPTPLPVLQKLGGWADIRMVLKYAHLAPDYTAQYAGDSAALLNLGAAPTVPTAGSVVELLSGFNKREAA